jgi:glycosyltransferase involved in cell wall biosynthesis
VTQPLVSVVVSTYFSGEYLEKCLASIRGQTYRRIELVVVDSRSTDATRDIAGKYADKFFVVQAGERSAKRNFGVSQGQGEYVFISDSDMIFSPEVIESCVARVSSDASVVGLVVPEASTGAGFWARCKALERSFYVGVDWMEAARFFRRSAFMEIGGYDEANTGSEDYDLPQRMKLKYGDRSVGRVDRLIHQNEVDIGLIRSCRKKFYYARSFVSYRSREANAANFSKQSSIFRRYRLFLSKPGKLFADPLVGLGVLFMKTCEFAAGGLGFLLARMRSGG